jgi:hypothetical protein
VAAVRAAAEQLDAVPLDLELGPAGEAPCQAIHVTLGELDDATAAIADQMMAVVLALARVVAVAVVHVHARDQVEARQEIHGAVDAGQTDPGVERARAAVHLGDLEVFAGIPEHVENRPPGPGEFEPVIQEGLLRVVVWHGKTLN